MSKRLFKSFNKNISILFIRESRSAKVFIKLEIKVLGKPAAAILPILTPIIDGV